VVLHHEDGVVLLQGLLPGPWLRSALEVALAAILREGHHALRLPRVDLVVRVAFLRAGFPLSPTLRLSAATRSSTLGSSSAALRGAAFTRLVPCLARLRIIASTSLRKVSVCSDASHSASIDSISVRASFASSGFTLVVGASIPRSDGLRSSSS